MQKAHGHPAMRFFVFRKQDYGTVTERTRGSA